MKLELDKTYKDVCGQEMQYVGMSIDEGYCFRDKGYIWIYTEDEVEEILDLDDQFLGEDSRKIIARVEEILDSDDQFLGENPRKIIARKVCKLVNDYVMRHFTLEDFYEKKKLKSSVLDGARLVYDVVKILDSESLEYLQGKIHNILNRST